MKENLQIFTFLTKNTFWSILVKIFIGIFALYGLNTSLDMMSAPNDISLLLGIGLALISIGVLYKLLSITVKSLI